MILEHVILFFAWIFYYLLHSVFASNQIKSWTGLKPKTYRLLYSLIATVLLFIVLLYGATIYSVLLYAPNNTSTYTGLMLSAVGIFIIKRSFRKYSFREFVGLKKEENTHLVVDGIQKHIRHPLYTGTLMIFVGYFVFNPQASNLIMLFSLIIYLPFGIKSEERKLIEHFGEAYIGYKESTPALFPKFRGKYK